MKTSPKDTNTLTEFPYTVQPITDALEKNYMPYAMSVIVSRAIPEIDGFKPSHRKLLYTMYKMGLLGSGRTKSANIVGQTMKLNPHGDAAIYETMVRLSEGHQALLSPFVDSKGNFGKIYSRDMSYAASRYTEAKLAPICSEIFADIDADAVDFVDNYDGELKEPVLLPTTFPNVLTNANMGIAVGMASSICGFNLVETCQTAIELIKNPEHELIDTLKAPDFATGGIIVLDRNAMKEIYNTGRGSFKIMSKWNYLKAENIIEITEIPYSTNVESIIDKLAELIKAGKIREISDVRDETDLSGLKITIDLKRGTDPDKLMQKLMKMTPLMDSFSCNFNILIDGMPRVMGVREILNEWTKWRQSCIRRCTASLLEKKKEKLHLLMGLRQILLDIDKAIAIIRNTEEDADVVPNLMIGFGIDQIQAEFVAEIKLRNINKEHILKKLDETSELEKEISDLQDLLGSEKRINKLIIKKLEQVIKKYGQPRKSEIAEGIDVSAFGGDEEIPDYPVNIFVTAHGYFKKITPQSLRMSSEQKLKDGDKIVMSAESTNRSEMILLTNMQQAYKTKLSEYDDTKASLLGEYLPTKLGMESGEVPVFSFLPKDYSGSLVFVFENGKVAKVELKSYDTKSNRKRLTGAYSDKSPLVAAFCITDDTEIVLYSSSGRILSVHTSQIAAKSTRNTQGIFVMTLKNSDKVDSAMLADDARLSQPTRYRAKKIPAAGATPLPDDKKDKQLTIF